MSLPPLFRKRRKTRRKPRSDAPFRFVFRDIAQSRPREKTPLFALSCVLKSHIVEPCLTTSKIYELTSLCNTQKLAQELSSCGDLSDFEQKVDDIWLDVVANGQISKFATGDHEMTVKQVYDCLKSRGHSFATTVYVEVVTSFDIGSELYSYAGSMNCSRLSYGVGGLEAWIIGLSPQKNFVEASASETHEPTSRMS
jgi:hypothetical protein